MLTRHRGAADQAGFLAGDEERRDRLQQPLVGRVRLEGGAELRLVEQRPKPARDPAGDVDAAECLEGEREAAGKAPEQAHEQSRRRLPGRLARQRARGNGLCLVAGRARVERAREPPRPGPDSTASALTVPHSWRSRVNTSISSAACGPNEACPPSLATTCQRPSAGKSAATPSPVPGPSTTLTPARAATGLPSGRVCAAPSRGSAQAMASKSLSTRSCENPKRLANSRRRNRQPGRLVSAISSPSTGPATASVAARGRAPVSSR